MEQRCVAWRARAGNGTVDRHEFIQHALYDSLSRSSAKVVDVFKKFDTDGNHHVDKKEFRRGIICPGTSMDPQTRPLLRC